MTFSPRMSLVRATLLACALFACAAAPAGAAVHWPGSGGDAGHSGAQPVDAGVAPVTLAWKQADGVVRTAPVVSGGPPATQRLMYGTSDGVVHFRRLADGNPLGGADVGADADVFGPVGGAPGSNRTNVTFADTSTETALGQLFVAHNDGSDIHIARFDEADGSLVDDVTVPGTTGLTIASSLLAGPGGDLFFVAGGRLFKVSAGGAVTDTGVVNANPDASPVLMNLDGSGTPHVAIGTTDGFLRTYRASDLDDGPFVDLSVALGPQSIVAGDVMAPSVPVQRGGGLAEPSPFVYVAASAFFPYFPFDDDGVADTVAYKLHVVNGALEFQGEFLPVPDTDPGPGLAVSQLASAEPADAEVLIPTSGNLYLATTRDMDLTGEIDFESDLVAGTDGFRQTTPATSGPLYYATNDRGEQFVGRLSDGKVVEADEFTRDAANAGFISRGTGQPAISRGYVAFGGPDGVFVYRNTDATDPEVALTAPAAEATVSGDMTVAAIATDARGVEKVEFRANGRPLGTDTSATGDSFSIVVDTDAMPAGEYVLDAIATDSSDRTAISDPRRVVVPAAEKPGEKPGPSPSPGEDAPPTVAFSAPAAGALLSGTPTLTATASDDRGVASVRFLAGERTVCTDTTAPYECAYTLTADDVGRATLVAVATDSAGQTGTAVRGVRVDRFAPPAVTAKTTRRGLRVTTTGRVRKPKGVTAKQACGSGLVSVQIKAVRKTISSRRVRLGRSCTFRSRVTFRSRKRFPKSERVTVRVRFLGNAVLGPRRAKSATLRTR